MFRTLRQPSPSTAGQSRGGTPAPRPAESLEDLLVRYLAVLGAVALVAGLGLWLTGELAGLAVHRRWPAVPATDAFTLLAALPRHVSNPADAGPPKFRTQLAGPAVFYATGALLLTTAGAVAARGVLWLGAHRAARRRRERDRSVSWASAHDIRHLLVRDAGAGRVVLGRLGRRLVAAEARRSVMVIAPTQAGKTTRFVIPTVLRWDGPMLITSVKSDVLRATLDQRRRRGRVHVFDPTGSSGLPTAMWSPLLSCTDYPGAERTARWLIEANGETAGVDNTRFWETLGGKLLAPLLLAAAHTGGGLRQVGTWLDCREKDQVSQVLEGIGDLDALSAWAASCAREQRQRDSVYATAESILNTFASPSVRAATDITGADHLAGRVLHPEQLIREGQTLYLVAPAHDQKRLRPLFEALVQAVLRAAQDTYAATGAPLDPALMLMLDEAANIAPIRDLASYAATGAGQGIQIVSVWQDLAQVEAIYGRRAATVVNGHTARVFLPGSADLATLEATSKMIGDHQLGRSTISTSHDGSRSITETTTDSRVAPPEYLRQLPSGTAVVLYGREPVMRLHTTAWYQDRTLRAMAGPPPPGSYERPPVTNSPRPEGPPAATAGTNMTAVAATARGRPPTHYGDEGVGIAHLADLTPAPGEQNRWRDRNTGRDYVLLYAPDGTPLRLPTELTAEEHRHIDACQRIDLRAVHDRPRAGPEKT